MLGRVRVKIRRSDEQEKRWRKFRGKAGFRQVDHGSRPIGRRCGIMAFAWRHAYARVLVDQTALIMD